MKNSTPALLWLAMLLCRPRFRTRLTTTEMVFGASRETLVCSRNNKKRKKLPDGVLPQGLMKNINCVSYFTMLIRATSHCQGDYLPSGLGLSSCMCISTCGCRKAEKRHNKLSSSSILRNEIKRKRPQLSCRTSFNPQGTKIKKEKEKIESKSKPTGSQYSSARKEERGKSIASKAKKNLKHSTSYIHTHTRARARAHAHSVGAYTAVASLKNT